MRLQELSPGATTSGMPPSSERRNGRSETSRSVTVSRTTSVPKPAARSANRAAKQQKDVAQDLQIMIRRTELNFRRQDFDRSHKVPFFNASDGVRIFYEEAGSGFPVVMTHGLGDCAELWSPL